jgi:hypothetical protein
VKGLVALPLRYLSVAVPSECRALGKFQLDFLMQKAHKRAAAVTSELMATNS